ncbi:MAG: TorF family putative porin [Woeseiaceae bacterium]
MTSNTWGSSLSGEALAMTLLLAAAGQSEANDAERAWSTSVGLGSDLTFRGVSQTMGNPAIQASVDVDLSSGLYAYAWGSNVDFIPEGEPNDGATHEIDLAIGYATDITDDWSVDLALIRYVFPGTVSDVDYDYSELVATVWFAGAYSATVAYSGDIDGSGADSVLYELGASFGLPSETTFQISYGHYDLSDAYGAAYSYANAALARSIGNMEIALAYIDTFHSAEFIYGDQATGPRFVLSLQVEW